MIHFNADVFSNTVFIANIEEWLKAVAADGNFATQREYEIYRNLEQQKEASRLNNVKLIRELEFQFKALVY